MNKYLQIAIEGADVIYILRAPYQLTGQTNFCRSACQSPD